MGVINIKLLNVAIENTFKKRESINLLNDTKNIMVVMKSDKRLESLWEAYKSKNVYVSDITFLGILKLVENKIQFISIAI